MNHPYIEIPIENTIETPTIEISTETQVIEIITENIDNSYLAYLQGIRCSYIFSGKNDIIIPFALKKLRKYFGIKYLTLEGGSTINGSFLKEKCIDELNIIMVPITGETGDKTLFNDSILQNFNLIKSEPIGDGGILLNYKIQNEIEEEEDEEYDDD